MDSTDTVILGPDYPQARAEAQGFVAELAACVDGDEIELPPWRPCATTMVTLSLAKRRSP